MYNKKTIIDALRNLGNPTVPKKTAASEFEMGQEDDNWISAQNGVETPIYKKVKVAPSSIEGKGLFAEEPIKQGDVIGVSHIRQEFEKGGETYTAPFPSTVLGYYNHSEDPNVKEEDQGSHILMVAIKDIQPGEEITSDYNNHNIEDLETPDNFKKGGTKRPKIPKKKNSSAYSRSLEATNRLFAEHPLFEKPRSRKNKIYDPLSKYYANGGVTYNGLPVTYQQALENFVYPNVIDDPERTGYNSVNNTISYDSQSPIENMDNDWWREHELFHDLQNQAGGMSTSGVVGQRPNPYVASDYALQGYYDRREADINRIVDGMIAENPDLQFIPRDKLIEGAAPGFIGAEDLQYSDPSTLEGEARQYEQYIREGNPSIFPKQKNGGTANYIETSLTPKEIEQYVKGGYIVEDISVPSLTKASLGKIVKPVLQPIKPIVRDVIRSNYNPITYPLKSLAEGLAKQSSAASRTPQQITQYLFTKKGKEPTYFGTMQQPDFWEGEDMLGNWEYGIGKRDLLANYFRGIDKGFEPIDYDFSADPGLESVIQEYGPLKAFKLNSQIQHGEPIDIFSLRIGNLGLEKYGLPQGTHSLFGDQFIIDPRTGSKRYIHNFLPGNLNIFRNEYPGLLDEASAITKNRLNSFFDLYGQDTIPFELNYKPGYQPLFGMLSNPVKPIDDIAGHMVFLRRNADKEFDLTTRDLWGFRPQAYNQKYDINSFMKRKQSQLVDVLGKPFVLTQTNPIRFKKGGTPGEEECPEGFSYDAELGCVPVSPDNMTEVQKWITDWYANRKIQFPENDPQYTEGMQKVLPQYNTESPMGKQSQAFPVYKDFPTEVEETPGGYGAAGQFDTTGDVPIVWFNPELTDEKKKDVETHELTNYINYQTSDITNPINDWLIKKHVIEKDKTWPKEKKQFYDYMLDSNEQNIQSYLNVARRKFGLKPDEVVTKERLEQMRAEAEAQGMFDQNNKETFNPDIYLLFHTTKTPEGLLDWFNYIAKEDTPKVNDETQYAKMGGESEYQLGDEVDEATMKKLKELGYTFQMAK